VVAAAGDSVWVDLCLCAGVVQASDVEDYFQTDQPRRNTSESTVEKWESGVKKPSGMAVKLLTIVQKHGLQMLA
jgi:putative transcriptional regulator